MGFTFRKRNPNGFNVSLSSRGLRISKTAKMGNTTANIGHYFGGTHGGKTTGSVRAGSNGIQYRKDFTVGSHFKNNLAVDTKTYSGEEPPMASWYFWLFLHVNFYASIFYLPYAWNWLFGAIDFTEGSFDWLWINALYGIAGWAPILYLFYRGSRLYDTNHERMPLGRTVWLSQIILFWVVTISTLYYLAVLLF